MNRQGHLILALESSCDDSAYALIDARTGCVVAEKTLNLSYLHSRFGGVVPEVAGRGHLSAFKELLGGVLQKPGFNPDHIAAIAVTTAPGLIGSLLVGTTYAKTLAWIYNKPFIPVDHIEGHLFSGFIGQRTPRFPFLSLVISGGHTLLVKVIGIDDYTLLGRSTDDSVGEAFDKVARMLGFTYPGGPVIEKLAGLLPSDVEPETFTVPLRRKKTLDFSFSGIKTAVLYLCKKRGLYHPDRELLDLNPFLATTDKETLHKIVSVAAGFQRTVVKIFDQRIRETIGRNQGREFHVSGGVAANGGIRDLIGGLQQSQHCPFTCPPLKYCGDNAAMIAYVAYLYYIANRCIYNPQDALTFEPSSTGKFSRMKP